jgi:hypothetical protein
MLFLAALDPRLTVALPFIVGAILLVAGSGVALLVEIRVQQALAEWAKADGGDTARLTSYAPETLARSVGWTTDAAQIVALVLTPILGLLLLEPSLSAGLGLLYILAFAVALVGEFCFLALVPVDRYHAKSVWIFSPVTITGVVLNLIAGAYAIGP